MSFIQRQAAHCDQCSHEWLVVAPVTPKHCAKCKSRRWNSGAAALPDAVKQQTDPPDPYWTPIPQPGSQPVQFFRYKLPTMEHESESQDFRDYLAESIRAASCEAKLVTYSCKFCDEIWLPIDGVSCPNCGTQAASPEKTTGI